MLLSIGGATAVAAMSVVMYVESLVAALIYGMVDSMQPAISYCKGAGLKNGYMHWKTSSYFCGNFFCNYLFDFKILRSVGSTALCETGDTELLTLSIQAMSLYALSYLVNWIDGCLSGFLTALGEAGDRLLYQLQEH